MIISIQNRKTKAIEKEDVYFESSIKLLYGNRWIGKFLLHALAKRPFMAWLTGCMQKMGWTKKNIKPFIERFKIDASEFLDPVESYQSFNDFFIRALKPSARPITDAAAIIPADARYKFYQEIGSGDLFTVKGRDFCLETLLNDKELSDYFMGGSMVLARLAPVDLHRFYFPCNCTPDRPRLINGPLYSVSPIAIRDNPWIYGTNRRCVTVLEDTPFGKMAYLEIGATSVGSIQQTFNVAESYKKGDEKGYFEFGGSALILLFAKDAIAFDQDLLDATKMGIEIKCEVGQSMGKQINSK